MDQFEQMLQARLATVKPVQDRIPFIGEGPSKLIVDSIEVYYDTKLIAAALGNKMAGMSVRGTFIVEQSAAHTPGSKVCKTWNLFKPSKFETQANDADRFVDFVCKLQGIAIGQHGPSMNALLKSQAEGGQLEAQIARGVRIDCMGIKASKPTVNVKTGEQTWYVTPVWTTNADQTAESIAATRAQMGAYVPRREEAAPVPAAHTPPPQAPAAPMFAPHAPAAPAAPAAPGNFLSFLK